MRSSSPQPSRLLGCLVSALVLATLTSCAAPEVIDAGLGPDPSEPVSVVVSPDSATIGLGEALQLLAGGRNAVGDLIAIQTDWEATGGAVSASGMFTSSVAGRFVVRGRAHGKPALRDSSIVTVTAAPRSPVSVSVTPGTVSLAAGAAQAFAATMSYDDGTTGPATATWTATGGTINGSGLYTAGSTAGTFRVIATSGTLADTSIVTITPTAPTLTAVILTPASASVAAGTTRQFSVIGQRSDGSTTPVSVNWVATGGTITGNGLYTAGSGTGSFRVIATLQGGTLADTSAVTVTAPVLTQVIIAPANATVLVAGTQQFSVSGQLSDGSSNTPQVTYTATGGTITAGGLYTAGATTGTFRVIAIQQGGSLADTATVNVTTPTATLQQIILTPATANLLSGAIQQFAVSGLMSDGSTIVPAVTYSATGGSITAGGRYTAGGTAGSFRVIATQQGGTLADTSSITITVPPPVLTQIILTPATASVQTGATQQFAVSGLMSDGSSTTPQVTYTATGGTISVGGLYTAGGTAGSFRVIATQQGGTLADTSTVTVTAPPPTLQAIVLSPASATLAGGATRQFSVAGQMSDGSTSTVQVTYSATGGSITVGGLYTAGSTPGAFRVIAVQQGGTLADTSAVTVTAPVLSQVILTPSSVSLQVGAPQQFAVSGRMTDGSTTTVQVNYSATGGSITTGGLYTAGATPGSFRVIAIQQGGTLADTSTVTLTAAPPVLTGVVVSPATASVAASSTRQFTVSGQWSDGSTTAPQVTWTATGGSISAGGLYSAGSTTGSFRVIATQVGGSLADTADVTITAGPPPGTPLFSSDWSAGLLDGAKWTRWGGQGVLAAVAPTGLGFPTGMTNVLRVGMGTGSFDWVEADGKWTLPAIGESRAFRLYLRNDVGAVSGGWSATHPVESKGTDGSISGNFYAWHIGSNTDGTFPIAFGTEASYPRNYISTSNTGADVGTLQKGVTYRLEWRWTRTATSTYSLDLRITDPSGTVIENNSTMRAWGGSTLASNNTGFPVDAAFMTGIRVGINGGFSASGTQNVYWGGFAVCADWCGAYSSF
jgi:hypothetical protein